MQSIFHPWLAAQRLQCVNRLRTTWSRPAETLFAATASAAALVLLPYLLRASGQHFGESLVGIPAQYPLPVAATSALLCIFLVRRTLGPMSRTWKLGWMAALPIASAQVRRTRLLLTAAITLLLLGVPVAIWFALGVSGTGAALATAGVLPPTAGLLAGGLLAALTGNCWPAIRTGQPRQRSTSLPLPDLLPASELRSINVWQRVLLAQRWRVGAGWPWMVAGGLLLPGGEGMRNSVGFLSLVLAVAWWRQALSAAGRCIRAADVLLRAHPLSPARYVAACLRYPLLASIVAGGIIGTALLAMGAPVVLAFVCLLAVVGFALLQLSITLRYRRQPGRARVLLGVDLVVVVLLWQAFPPLVLLLPLRIHQHLVLARRVL